MKRFLNWKALTTAVVVLFFIAGGYLGYLSALVDLDEQEFLQRVEASTDRARLERQLKRAKSVLEARSRAYLRRSIEFVRGHQAERLGVEPERMSVQDMNELLQGVRVDDPLLTEDFQRILLTLREEQEDLQFFQDEVETIELILARLDDSNVAQFLASDRERRRVSDGLRRLLVLLDKRRQLQQEQKEAKERFTYWERNPKTVPGSVNVTVTNKGSGNRTLEDGHATQISTGLALMPSDFDGRLNTLYVVYGDPNMRRGMAGVGVLFMKGEEQDFFRVLIHEMGHIYDLHREVDTPPKSDFYDGQYRLSVQDPSVEFYSYGWANTHERTADKNAYPSTYGMTDPFEDFAESFALYVLQGDTFADWQRSDSVMARKYAYLNAVFFGKTFSASRKFFARPYDVTMLFVDYDLLLEGG